MMKKHVVIALTVILTASLLTVPVYAAGLMDGLRNIDVQIRDAAAIIFGIAAIGGGGLTFWQTRSKGKTIGLILFFVLLIALAKSSDIMNGWSTEISGWF